MNRSERRGTVHGDAVLKVLEGALAEARANDWQIVVAVMDGSGRLTGLLGTENAPHISHRVAQDKAFTAAMTGMPTRAWKAYVATLPDHEREIILKHDGYVGADGGFPLQDGGLVIGGVGVSGPGQAEDARCARAGLRAAEFEVGETSP